MLVWHKPDGRPRSQRGGGFLLLLHANAPTGATNSKPEHTFVLLQPLPRPRLRSTQIRRPEGGVSVNTSLATSGGDSCVDFWEEAGNASFSAILAESFTSTQRAIIMSPSTTSSRESIYYHNCANMQQCNNTRLPDGYGYARVWIKYSTAWPSQKVRV